MRLGEGISLRVLCDEAVVVVFLKEGCVDDSWSSIDATTPYS